MQASYSFEELVDFSNSIGTSRKRNRRGHKTKRHMKSDEEKVNTSVDLISDRPGHNNNNGGIIRKLTRCFCVQLEADSSNTGKEAKSDERQSGKGYQKQGRNREISQEKGDIPIDVNQSSMNLCLNYATNNSDKPPFHPSHISETMSSTHSDIQRRFVPDIRTQNNNAGLAVKDINGEFNATSRNMVSVRGDDQTSATADGQFYHEANVNKMDVLDPLMIAVSEVLSASKLLSNAMDVLKMYASAVESKSSEKCGIVPRINNREHDLKNEDYFKNLAHVYSCDHVIDIPPLSELHGRAIPTVTSYDDLYQYASSNVRIFIEDTDPIEVVKCKPPDAVPKVCSYLIPQDSDRCKKSAYPMNTNCAQLQNMQHTSDSLLIQESNSNCQTILTSSFRIFSTEETQVTDVDGVLTTDESDQSTESLIRPKPHIHTDYLTAGAFRNDQTDDDRHYSRSQNDRCLQPLGIPRALPRRSNRSVQSWASNERGADHIRSSHEYRIPELDGRDHSWDEQIVPALLKQSSIIVSSHQPREIIGNYLPAKRSPGSPRSFDSDSRPFPVILDADELSFEVLYQHNNHNREHGVSGKNLSRNFNNSRRSKAENSGSSHHESAVTDGTLNMNYNIESTSTSAMNMQESEHVSSQVVISSGSEHISGGLRRSAISDSEVLPSNERTLAIMNATPSKALTGSGDDPISTCINSGNQNPFRNAIQIVENHLESTRIAAIRNRHSAPNLSPALHNVDTSTREEFTNLMDDVYESILEQIHLLFAGHANLALSSQRCRSPNTGDMTTTQAILVRTELQPSTPEVRSGNDSSETSR